MHPLSRATHFIARANVMHPLNYERAYIGNLSTTSPYMKSFRLLAIAALLLSSLTLNAAATSETARAHQAQSQHYANIFLAGVPDSPAAIFFTARASAFEYSANALEAEPYSISSEDFRIMANTARMLSYLFAGYSEYARLYFDGRASAFDELASM